MHFVLEIGVLYARFDRVERRGDRDGRHGTDDRRDEVLGPRRLAIILHAEYIILRDGARSKQLKLKLKNPPRHEA